MKAGPTCHCQRSHPTGRPASPTKKLSDLVCSALGFIQKFMPHHTKACLTVLCPLDELEAFLYAVLVRPQR